MSDVFLNMDKVKYYSVSAGGPAITVIKRAIEQDNLLEVLDDLICVTMRHAYQMGVCDCRNDDVVEGFMNSRTGEAVSDRLLSRMYRDEVDL